MQHGKIVSALLFPPESIHAAVILSEGKDAYTGEMLDWKLPSKYSNADSQLGRHESKAKFALLPTVDHVSASASEANFCICGWRINDAKNDIFSEAFLDLCEKALTFAGYQVPKPPRKSSTG
jgi:hypothetical protein